MRQALPGLLIFMSPELGLSISQKGTLLSAVAFGYFFTQVPGGALADRVGAKNMITAAMTLSACCCMAIPTCAAYFGVTGIWMVIALMGAVQGPLFPTSFVHLSRWLPRRTPGGRDEKAWGAEMLDIGVSVGSAIIVPVTNYLSQTLGWRHAYHIIGAFSLLFVLTWMVLGAESPSTCSYITPEELKFISENLGTPAPPKPTACKAEEEPKDEPNAKEKRTSRSSSPAPTRKQAASPAAGRSTGMPLRLWFHPSLWAIFTAHMAFNYGGYFQSSFSPMYYNEVLHLTTDQSKYHLMIPFCANLVMKVLNPILNDIVLHFGFSLLSARRIFTAVGFLSAGVAFLPIYHIRALNPWFSTTLFIINCACIGLAPNGFKSNYLDVTEKYVGVVSGAGNSLATLSSWASPLFVTYILKNFEGRWDLVHISLFVMNILASLNFVLCSTTTPIEKGYELEKAKKEQ